MTKADITEKVSNTIGVPKREAADLVETVLSIMKDTLASGERIKISGFGCFNVKQKTDRRGRNPQTGERLTISARRVLTFKPSSILRDAINSVTDDSSSQTN
ncbi:integration host factor subunit alpha [Pelobacter propionicus]|uniref:Integration host factor subunit alpha n=1 Tax=Pelobacter propionicus (strain DSM 2379 / NBRC 103807 / OttBd1) TaxID=338966 RepID=A0R7V1_PELPD|nr:integration host factor subunit alpha [Pelobacter propionicus]ABL01344.1 histone family protein DNA-binding protein [Pelobacter propionicus DSM 2379]